MDKKSVVFFMLYHKRPEVTRMSLWHMAKVIKKFKEAGHECEGIVIGSEPEQKAYCEDLGLEHVDFPNNPLNEKFKKAWVEALARKKDYICWLGSNNVHSDSFWDKCLEKISGSAIPSFGTKNFTIVDADKANQKTMKWTRRRYHVCSCGQFFYSKTIRKTVDMNTIFERDVNKNKNRDFDGSLNKALTDRWGADTIQTIDSEGLDCIDVKTGEDIHAFDRYKNGRYPQEYTRDEIFQKFEELQMLEEGAFKRL